MSMPVIGSDWQLKSSNTPPKSKTIQGLRNE